VTTGDRPVTIDVSGEHDPITIKGKAMSSRYRLNGRLVITQHRGQSKAPSGYLDFHLPDRYSSGVPHITGLY
jgi:hypothetical protein